MLYYERPLSSFLFHQAQMTTRASEGATVEALFSFQDAALVSRACEDEGDCSQSSMESNRIFKVPQ